MRNMVMSGPGNLKYPVSDYLRVGMMGFVILMTIIMVKFVSIVTRSNQRLEISRKPLSLKNVSSERKMGENHKDRQQGEFPHTIRKVISVT